MMSAMAAALSASPSRSSVMGQQLACTACGGGDVHRGREGVVGGLAAVDVVVGVDRLLAAEHAAGELDGAVAITSLAFMLVWVPLPVCQTTAGTARRELAGDDLVGRLFDQARACRAPLPSQASIAWEAVGRGAARSAAFLIMLSVSVRVLRARRLTCTMGAAQAGRWAQRAMRHETRTSPMRSGAGSERCSLRDPSRLRDRMGTSIGPRLSVSPMRVMPGEWVLVHSAAGGVGSALLQIARAAGCHVVGVVGAEHKVAAAQALGATLVIDRSRADLWAAARGIAPAGFAAVFDANGVSTLADSYGHLAPAGRLVVYGFHSMLPRRGGRPNWLRLAWDYLRTPRFSAMDLVNRNKSVMGFNLSYMFHRGDLLGAAMGRILGGFAAGTLRMPAVTTYPLTEVAQAHADLESGRTVGKLVLVP
jgi:hypothetical protein